MTAPNEIGYERVLVPVGDKADPNMLTELSSTLVRSEERRVGKECRL